MIVGDSSGKSVSAGFGGAGGRRWAGIAPFAVSLVFILLFGTLLWFIRTDKTKAMKAELFEDAEEVRESIQLRLNGTREYLRLLAEDRANGRLSPEAFRQKAARFVADHPELINITWVDSRFIVRDVAPLEGNRQILGLSLNLPEPKRASHQAREQRQAVYTRPFEAIQGKASFEAWVPVFKDDRFLGFFAGVYSCGKLLEVVPHKFRGEDHILLVDGAGAVLGEIPAVRPRNTTMVRELSLAPPGHDVKVRLQRYGAGGWGWEITLLAVVCIALISGMGYGMWALNTELGRREQAEDALRESGEELRSLFENSMDGILRTMPDGTILGANPAACEMLGRTEDEICRGGRGGVVDLSDPRLPVLLERRAREGKSVGELTFVRKDGTKFPVDVSSRLYKDRHGKFRTSMVFRDITERKRTESAMMAQSLLLEAFFENTLMSIAILDRDFNFLRVNEAYARADERNVADFPGHNHFEFYPSDAKAIFEEVVATKKPYMTYARPFVYAAHPERGVTYWDWTLVPLLDARDEVRTLLFTLVDVSNRQRAEEALRESELKYRVLVANADEAIFIAQDDIVKFPNPKALKMTGYPAEELANVRFADLIHPDDRDLVRERYLERLRGGTPPERYPFRMLDREGREIWVQLTAVLIDWEGRPGVLCFLRDITKERNLEAQFLRSQKMEAVGRLAGGVAHDFNNLLTVTIGYCDLVLARIGPLDPLRHDLEEIRKSSDRCASLTRQLLAFSRKQILDPKVINLGDIVADMDKMLRRLIGEDIDLVSVRGGDLWNVKADPGQVEQVIVNLAVNSRDAMPRGGKLTIETSNVALDAMYGRGHEYVSPGSYVMLAVSDTGHGMDAGTLARIFEPFFTTKEKGTGLGLSTVYGIVKQSGGYINVYSEPGIGTAFKIYFPRVEEAVTGISGAVLPAEEFQGSETILVVEDEDAVREMVRKILARYGYTVLEARNGGEAVELCTRRAGAIHLILTDVVMPGMNGVELSERLAPLHPGLKVLFMSGYTADAIVHQGILEPGIAFIQKPFTMDALAHKVREVLGPGPATG